MEAQRECEEMNDVVEITDGESAAPSSGEEKEVQQQAADEAVARETMSDNKAEGRSELPGGCLLPREQDALSGESEDIKPAGCGGEEQGTLEEVKEEQMEEEEQKGEGEDSREQTRAEDELSHVSVRRTVNHDVMWANQEEADSAFQSL